MKTQTPGSPTTDIDSRVDASRPFRSVKEAVAIFGDRLLTREILSSPTPSRFSLDNETPDSSVLVESPNKPLPREALQSSKPPRFDKETSDSHEVIQSPNQPPSNAGKHVEVSFVNEPTPSPKITSENENHGNIVHGNDLVMMMMVLKKLESELQETKMELKLLKERESETEVALASLNAELHKNMSKIAKAEAAEAAKAAAKSMASLEGGKREMETQEEKARGDVMVKTIDSPTLAQILSISDYEGYFKESRKVSNKLMKKKPVVPLVTDIFPWKKKSSPSNDLPSPIFSSNKYFV